MILDVLVLEFFGVGDGEFEIVLFNGFVVVVLFSVLERKEKILCYYILRNEKKYYFVFYVYCKN